MILRKLRLEKGWSQEQLADASGVSTRTIQRIERGGTASLESLKCFAAVFETNISELKEIDPMTTDTALSPDDRAALNMVKQWTKYYDYGGYDDPDLTPVERDAMEYVRDIKSFYANLWSYVLMMIVLVAIKLFGNVGGTIWITIPAVSWGIGVIAHGLSVYEIFSPFGDEWEKRQIKKRLGSKA